jgi:hypothetical protein
MVVRMESMMAVEMVDCWAAQKVVKTVELKVVPKAGRME